MLFSRLTFQVDCYGSQNIHMNVRTQGFPPEHYSVVMISGFNVVADQPALDTAVQTDYALTQAHHMYKC